MFLKDRPDFRRFVVQSGFIMGSIFALPVLHAAEADIEVAFSPWDEPEQMITGTLAKAKASIYVQAYLLTSRKIAQALVDAHKRGILVRVLVDANMNKRPSPAIVNLVASGISVQAETAYNAAHNKIILVDPEKASGAIITGSYNFTYAAREKNAENLLVIRSHPDLNSRYLQNWERHAAQAVPYSLQSE